MASSGFKLRPLPILAVAAVVGIAAGLIMSRRQELEEHMALEHMAQVVEDLPATRFPAPPDEKTTRKIDLRAVEGLPPYPNAVPANILNQGQGVGGEMQIAWFSTQDDPDAVISFYEKAFAEKGIPFVSHFYSAKAGYVGYLEPAGERFHMLLAIKEGHQTVVLPSSSNPKKLLDSMGQKLPADVPEMPGLSSSMVFDFDERALAQRSYVATMTGKTVDEVANWYVDNFRSKGWTVSHAATPNGEATIDARMPPKENAPSRSASLTIRREKTSVTVYLTLSG
jgi:hypothetical protein